jgi:transcriptional regulator with XRE-family HTH domain
MRRDRGTAEQVEGVGESRRLAITLGRDARATRRRRRLTLHRLSERIGISRVRLGELERGLGANAPLALWVKLGIALGRPLAVSFSRDISAPDEPRDAGHLAAQELVLRLARGHGRRASVEVATKPWDPSSWADVVLRDDRKRVLLLIEIVNRAGDLGGGFRSTDRKAAELERVAILVGGDQAPYRVGTGWLLVDSAANRRLVDRYAELLRTRFPGSSAAWARALSEGSAPPAEPSIAWIDTRAGRIRALRRR